MKIITPDTAIIEPDYVDGLENLLTRQSRAQTQSTSFVTLCQIDLVPTLFSIAFNNRLKLEYIGRTIGAAGNKNIRIQFDGSTIYDSSAVGLSNAIYEGQTIIVFDGTSGVACTSFRGTSAAGTGGAVGVHQQGGSAAITLNPAIAHTILFQALLINAADTFILDWLGASFR